MTQYQPIDLRKHKSDILVVHCADPRFQAAYRQVIDGFDKFYDLLVMPGASKAIADNQLVVDNIKLLHSLHHFEAIHILDHIECGAFGKIDDEIVDHSKYLDLATKKLNETLPEVSVTPHLLGENQELLN